jgi:muramidase (phage lysozyme)
MLRLCEVGTTAPVGYRALFRFHPEFSPDRVFHSFDHHPNIVQQFRWNDGTLDETTAAGGYQISYSTWKSIAEPLRLMDFSPANQDRVATELTFRRKALDDVVAGRIPEAIEKCWPEWATLPASRYLQPVMSLQFCCTAYAEAGGILT